MNQPIDPLDTFISQIAALHPLEDAAQAFLYDHLKILERDRKEISLPVGMVNDSMYFVHSGLAMAYKVKEGKDYTTEKETTFFAPESNFAFSPPSFFNQKPSHEGIMMLEDSVLVALPYQELQEICQRFPATNALGRKITERYLLYFYELVGALKLPTGEKKYRWFIESHPTLGERVPNTELASFLGLSKESVSRIRGRKNKKKG
jgi:CRP-like cAMP-binding protein